MFVISLPKLVISLIPEIVCSLPTLGQTAGFSSGNKHEREKKLSHTRGDTSDVDDKPRQGAEISSFFTHVLIHHQRPEQRESMINDGGERNVEKI